VLSDRRDPWKGPLDKPPATDEEATLEFNPGFKKFRRFSQVLHLWVRDKRSSLI
jgi:hypothetical protein